MCALTFQNFSPLSWWLFMHDTHTRKLWLIHLRCTAILDDQIMLLETIVKWISFWEYDIIKQNYNWCICTRAITVYIPEWFKWPKWFGWPKMNFDRISRHFRAIRNFDFPPTKWLPAAILDDRSHFSPFQINTQFFIFFTKWLPAAILDDRKSLSIAFLAISDEYATFFSTKWLPVAILDDRKSLSIAFLAISDQYETFILFSTKWLPAATFDRISRHFRLIRNFFFTKWLPFWMTENHVWSHFSPFPINTQLFFHKMAAILDDRKSLLITFLAISDQYVTLIFFHKMAADGHFGWSKIAFGHMSRHFRSIRNFFFLVSQNGCRRPFRWPKNDFGMHFLAISDQYATFFVILFSNWLSSKTHVLEQTVSYVLYTCIYLNGLFLSKSQRSKIWLYG